MEESEKKEKERLSTGLAAFVQGLAGRQVCVELRNNNYVYGKLENCDSCLNMRIRSANVIRSANSEFADEFFVSGRHVRFVHLEHYADVKSAINRTLNAFVASRRLQKTKRIDAQQSRINNSKPVQ